MNTPDDSSAATEPTDRLDAASLSPAQPDDPVASEASVAIEKEAERSPEAGDNPQKETDWSPLHPSHLAMERRTSWVLFWVLLGIMLPVNGILYWSLGRTWGLFGSVMGTWVLAGALLWLIQVYLPRSHNAAGWMLSDRGIEIRKGVWWRHVTVVPKSRIQHTDLQQGPVLRAYGLAKLAIFTAGTENAEVELEGLSLETAQQVRDRLMEASRHPLQGL
jgi:uncharacterized protein